MFLAFYRQFLRRFDRSGRLHHAHRSNNHPRRFFAISSRKYEILCVDFGFSRESRAVPTALRILRVPRPLRELQPHSRPHGRSAKWSPPKLHSALSRNLDMRRRRRVRGGSIDGRGCASDIIRLTVRISTTGMGPTRPTSSSARCTSGGPSSHRADNACARSASPHR